MSHAYRGHYAVQMAEKTIFTRARHVAVMATTVGGSGYGVVGTLCYVSGPGQ
jgi:hypothetical protein